MANITRIQLEPENGAIDGIGWGQLQGGQRLIGNLRDNGVFSATNELNQQNQQANEDKAQDLDHYSEANCQ